MYAHQIGSFILDCPFPIPELPLAPLGSYPDVLVTYGTVPAHIHDTGIMDEALEVSSRQALLRIAGVAQILVSDGREVVIQPDPSAKETDLRAYLAAAVIGVLCHQHGMLPLHASSLQLGRGVVAFLGDSGAGKSTLAAFFSRRGYPVVSDDICLLDPGSPREVLQANTPVPAAVGPRPKLQVVPVAPWMKLWSNAVEQLGESPKELSRVFSDEEKYRLSVKGAGERLGLKQIFVLEWAEDGNTSIRIERLDTLHAIECMLAFTHQPYLVEGMRRTRECFELCGRALSGVEAYQLIRPRGFVYMESVVDALEAHFEKAAR